MTIKKLTRSYGSQHAGRIAAFRDRNGSPVRVYLDALTTIPSESGQVVLDTEGAVVVYVEDTTTYSVSVIDGATGVRYAQDFNVEVDSTSDASTGNPVGEAIAAKYTKPLTGIPATDLSDAVQASLGKADAALPASNVTNALTSTSTTSALSASQGKVLKDTADALATTVSGKADSVHTHTASQVSDSTAVGRSVLTASSQSTGRAALGFPPQLGVTISITTATTLSAAAHDGAMLECTNAPLLTINTGLGTQFSVGMLGEFSVTGTATVIDNRVPGTSVFVASLVPSSVADTYQLIGSVA